MTRQHRRQARALSYYACSSCIARQASPSRPGLSCCAGLTARWRPLPSPSPAPLIGPTRTRATGARKRRRAKSPPHRPGHGDADRFTPSAHVSGPHGPVICYLNRTTQSSLHTPRGKERRMTTDSPPTNRWLVLVIACLAQFMVVLDATIVNVALPSIQRGLDFSPTSLQWVVNSYTLIFGGFLLLGGRAADLLGRKRLFMAGRRAVLAGITVQRPRGDAGDADRRAGAPGARCRAGLPRRAVDHHHHASPTTPSAPVLSACGARSRPAVAPSASCSAAS